MNALLETIQNCKNLNPEDKKREIVRNMIERGQQVPLNRLMPSHIIQKLSIKPHVLDRYKQRFAKLYDIEIENMIRKDLSEFAMVVGKGHSGRWIVHVKGVILILDEYAIHTTYDANGKDRNNIVDPTRAKLKKIEKNHRKVDRLNELFDLIQKEQSISS